MKTKSIIIFALLFALPLVSKAAFGSADINQDTCTDASDFYEIQAVFGSANAASDLNNSGKVNLPDLAILAHSWMPCANAVNIRDLYPPAPNHNLTFIGFLPDGSPAAKYEVMKYEPWPDGKHFTHHHYYGNVGDAAPNCPRIDDVFLFDKNNLYYQDTFNFYPKSYPDGVQDPAGLTRTVYQPGQLWGQTTMFKGAQNTESAMTGDIYDIEQTDCVTTSQAKRVGTSNNTTRFTIEDSSTWSPYTGGQSKSVGTVLLTERTSFNGAADDLFEERWQFYKDAKYGYVPIEVTILKQSPGETSLQEIAHERLVSVQ